MRSLVADEFLTTRTSCVPEPDTYSKRRAYHRQYRREHAEIFQARARKKYAKQQERRWAYWLLDTLEFPPEPEYVVEVPQPVRRPTLRLRK